ncbi:MAG: potassium channel family protein [Desulfurococcales archaeon]|nr:potassium channel family protein [Desulfurococcales archaeon]
MAGLSLVEKIKELLHRIAGRSRPMQNVAREKVMESWEFSRKMAEELRRELLGDTIFQETVMVSLIVLSVVILIADYTFPAESIQAESIYRVDLLICIVLGLEFAYRLSMSPEKKVFLNRYWYELLALTPAYLTAMVNIPLLAAFLRLLRLVRVYRVYKVLGKRNIYLHMIVDIIREARILQLLIVFLVGLSFTSVLAFMAEARSPEAQIKTLGDAFWWSLATVTTVGYGDLVPVTSLGKMIGVVLMLFGIAVLGGFISLTSTSIMRVLSRYQSIMRETALQSDYMKLRYLISRITELDETEYREMLRLIETIRARTLNK